MPALKNPKHEAFAQSCALGMSAAESYRQGYDCSDATAETNGPKLARDAQVKLRIAELRVKVAERADKKFDMTKEKWLERLARIAASAEESEDFSAATGALREIGKGAAFYAPEKVESEGTLEIIIKRE
jgi:phage terminase small subunit